MKHSKGLAFWSLTSLVIAALVLPGSLSAQGNFVYTNDNRFGPSTVSGFSVASNGTLAPVPGSPFATGGTGDGSDHYTTNQITVDNVGNFLFAHGL